MELLLYLAAQCAVTLLQCLPLPVVARLGRAAGALAYGLDLRHRRIALRNLTLCFQSEKSAAEIRAIAREHFRRLGENYCCAVKTATMNETGLKRCCEVVGTENAFPPGTPLPKNVVVAVGHFGNFELFARFGQLFPSYRCATTYRGLRQRRLDRLVQSLRAKSGCLYFERRSGARDLRAAMNRSGMILGLLADQHAGRNGVWVPFFGHICSTSAAPAVFALRYRAPLLTGFCFRTGLGRWRICAGPSIPTHHNGKPRSIAEITLDVNRALEAAIRQDPANWFWVHKRWKPEQQPRPPATSTTPIPTPAPATSIPAESSCANSSS